MAVISRVQCRWPFALAFLLFAALLTGITSTSAAVQGAAIDFAAPQPVIDLGPSLMPERVAEPGDPRGSWFTLAVQNRQSTPVTRLLTSFSPPGSGLNSEPLPARPTILQVVPSDPSIIVERAPAFGPNAFRVLLPPGRNSTLTLHFENATR